MSMGKQCLPLCRLSPILVTYNHEVASIPLGEVSRSGKLFGFIIEGPTDESPTLLPKAAKPVWAIQLIRQPCLVIYVKFKFDDYYLG